MDEWRSNEVGLWPQIWGQERVGLSQGVEESSDEVLSGSGLTSRVGVNVLDTGEQQNFLGNLGSDATGSSGSWDESDTGRTALALHL